MSNCLLAKHFQTFSNIFKQFPVLQAWKTGQPPLDKVTPRYKKEPPAEEIPKATTQPTLKCCQVVDGKLIIPSDVRNMFISCPVFSPEWRQMLADFDKCWSAPIGEPSPKPSPVKRETAKKEEGATGTTKTEAKAEQLGTYDWSATFKGEPETIEALKAKYKDGVTELAGSIQGLTFMLVPGPALFVAAPNDPVHLNIEQPLIAHGAGTWLLGEKAKKFTSANPGKGFPCNWTSDDVPVVIED